MPSHAHPFPAVIDSTIRNSFASCPQQWYYQTVEGLASGHVSVHLHAGACFARGLEVFRREFFLNKRDLEEAKMLACIAMVLEWGDFEPMFSWSPGAGPKTLDRLIEALDFYLQTWNPATDPIQPLIQGTEIGVEFSFALPIPDRFHPETGDPLLYAGRFDMLGTYNGVLFIVDEKTTTQLGQSWADQWDMRSQFTGYCWAARQYGYEVGGAVVRGISFLKHGFGSAEAMTYREPFKIDRWMRQLQRDVDGMIAAWESGDPNMNLGDTCSAFGGCAYKKLCMSEDTNLWKQEYVVRRWNPLERK